MRTCANCTNFAVSDDLEGLPFCQLLNLPLGRAPHDAAGEPNAKLMEGIANACTNFSDTGTPVANPKRLRSGSGGNMVQAVIGMNPLQGMAASQAFDTNNQPSSCSKCRWFAQADVTLKELGWNFGLCTARSQLIPQKHVLPMARQCGLGSPGANATTTDGMILNGLYDNVLTVRVERRSSESDPQAPNFHSSIDPLEWPTDRPVEDHEAEAGIRAWRKVVDPTGYGPDAYAPIFDHEHENIAQYDGLGELIDPRETYGDFTPELYLDHAGILYTAVRLAMGGIDPTGGRRQTLALVGESGTGKSEFWAWFAWLMNLPLVRINVTPSMMADDLTGMVALDVVDGLNVTQFDQASFIDAYQKPCVIMLDEPNSASDDAWMFLRPTLDKGRQVNVSKVNLRFDRHVFCFMGLAMNPSWNPAYRGTREMSLADKRRIRLMKVPMPDRATEAEIVRGHCSAAGFDISEEQLKTLLDIGDELRGMYEAKAIPESWGVRENVAVAELLEYFDMERAFRLVALDNMEEDEKTIYTTAIRNYTTAALTDQSF